MGWDPLERLTQRQRQTLDQFALLLRDFNRRINLISREDEAFVFEHHILHSLCLSYRSFPPGCVVVDWGTGGGLPAIPLAVAMPEVRFVAVDAVGKKVHAVQAMVRRLDLVNLKPWHGRADEYDGMLDYSVARATAPLADLWFWHARAARPASRSASRSGDAELWQPGLVCLKGGDLTEEKNAVLDSVRVEEVPLSSLVGGAYFTDKVILACTPEGSAGA